MAGSIEVLEVTSSVNLNTLEWLGRADNDDGFLAVAATWFGVLTTCCAKASPIPEEHPVTDIVSTTREQSINRQGHLLNHTASSGRWYGFVFASSILKVSFAVLEWEAPG